MNLWDFKYQRLKPEEYVNLIYPNWFFNLTRRQQRFLIYMAWTGKTWLGNADYRRINQMEDRVSLASREIVELEKLRLLKSNGLTRCAKKYELNPYFGKLYKANREYKENPQLPPLVPFGRRDQKCIIEDRQEWKF